MEHKPNPSQASTSAILGQGQDHSSGKPKQSSSDTTSYAISTNQKKDQPSNSEQDPKNERNQP
jgi:hypothetical protein